jgi:hypothetical protein
MEEGKDIAPVDQEDLPKISAEALEVCRHYLQTWSIEQTARETSMSLPEVEAYLNKKEVKRYIDSIFLEQGYLNRFKIQSAFEEVIELKMQEMTESEMGSSKDIADLLFMLHKMRQDELKHITEREKAGPTTTKNVQVNNYGDNYHALTNALKNSKE